VPRIRNATLPRVIRPLTQSYATRWGAPIVDRVDTAIFVRTYFVHCMQCSYCGDSCCQYGADIDAVNVARVEAHAEKLERFTGIPRHGWWTGEWNEDLEFKSRRGRGCMLHSFALEEGIDYHELKPMVASLFPVTFDGGLLHPSNEIHDRSLQCIGDGPTLYKGVRSEIGWYFGDALLSELDAVEDGVLASGRAAK